MQPIPFRITNIDHGIREADGLLRLEDEKLVLEYQLKDSIMGVFKSDVEIMRIPIEKLSDASLKKRLFTTKLMLQASSMTFFDEVPGSNHGRLELKIKRRDRKAAENLASRITLLLSEARLRNLDTDG